MEIMRVDYTFAVDGQLYENTSFLPGWGPKGDKIEIEYLKSNPLRNRAVDGRTTIFGYYLSLTFLVILSVLIFFIRKAVMRVFVLKFGVRAPLTFTGLSVIMQSENSDNTYMHKFKFKDLNGKVVTGNYKSKSHGRSASDKLIYYLKSKPKVHQTLGQFERRGVAFTESKEEIDFKKSSLPFFCLILPIVFIVEAIYLML